MWQLAFQQAVYNCLNHFRVIWHGDNNRSSKWSLKPKEWPGDWRGAKSNIEERMIAQQSAACVGGLAKERRHRDRRDRVARRDTECTKIF